VYHRSYDSRLLLLALPGALIVLERRRIEGILLCVLVALSIVSIQHWLQLGLARTGLLEKVLHNKILLIALLRESDLRLLVCFGLLLFALARWNMGSEVGAGGEFVNDTPLIDLCINNVMISARKEVTRTAGCSRAVSPARIECR
jgi:hypothetical protein